MKRKFGRFIRTKCFSLLARVRFVGLRPYIVDPSAYWTSISYNRLMIPFLLKGRILLQISDIAEWGWVARKRVDVSCDLRLIDSVTYGLCEHFEVLPWDLENLERKSLEEVESGYRDRFLLYYRTLVAFHEAIKVRKVLYGQGYVSGADACRQFSLRFNVPRLAIENVANSERILWDDVSGIAVNRTLAKNYYYGFRNIINPENSLEYARRKISQIRGAKSADHTSGSGTCEETGFILFLGQVFTDTSILFSAVRGWGPIEVMKALKREASQHSLRLQIKLHPKEYMGKSSMEKRMYNSLTYRKLKEEPELLESGVQIDHRNTLDTYELIKKASVVVTMNSQAGLEAALFGKPVICCAESNYSNLGFTWECRDAKELEFAVSQALSLGSARRSRMYQHACDFDYIFNEIYCIPKTIRSLSEKACE